MTQTTHQLTVTFTQDQTLATWSLDGSPDKDRFAVLPGDKVSVDFDGPNDENITECVLISGQLQSHCRNNSPFTAGNRINLKSHPTITVGQEMGLWGFTISFSVYNGDGTSSFYFLPDPEMQVGTTEPDPA